jgi:hypothetical protein
MIPAATLPAGTVVPALEVFGAVGKGSSDAALRDAGGVCRDGAAKSGRMVIVVTFRGAGFG